MTSLTNSTTTDTSTTNSSTSIVSGFDNINGQDNIWKELVGTWAAQGNTWGQYIEQTSLTNV